MMQSKPERSEGFDVIIRPAPSGAGRTTPSQPGHYPLNVIQHELKRQCITREQTIQGYI